MRVGVARILLAGLALGAIALFNLYGTSGNRLIRAIERGDLQQVRTLLDADPSLVNFREGGLTPLHVASGAGQVDAVRLLVSAGSDVNAPGGRGTYSPLFRAVAECQLEAAEVLLELGAAVDYRASYRETPLMIAAGRCSENMGRLLLRHGANANAANSHSERRTALEIASWRGSEGFVKALLDGGAQPDRSLLVALKRESARRADSKLDNVIKAVERALEMRSK